MLSRTTTFLASIAAIATITGCSNPYSDVYSFKKNKFKAPKQKVTEITVPVTEVSPLQGQSVPVTDPTMSIPGVPSAPAPGIPGLPEPAAPTAPAVPAPGTAPVEAVPGTPPATTPVPAPGTPPATTPAIPGL